MVIRQLTVNTPSYPVAPGALIQAGAPVGLNADGDIAVYDGDTVDNFIGISADAKLDSNTQTSYSGTPVYSGATPSTRWTQNRIPDAYDNTWASGRITVFTGSSTLLFTDQFDADAFGSGVAPGAAIYAGVDGKFTTEASGDIDKVAILMSGPAVVPSGIPGKDAGQDGRLTDTARYSDQEDNTYILIQMV